MLINSERTNMTKSKTPPLPLYAPLNEKQVLFIDYYIQFLNSTEAAKRAGYSDKTAREQGNVLKHRLALHIQQQMDKINDERIAKRDEVLKFFSAVMRGEITEQAPLFIGDGVQELVDRVPTAKDRTFAAMQLARRYGLDRPDNYSTDDKVIINVHYNLPDDPPAEELITVNYPPIETDEDLMRID